VSGARLLSRPPFCVLATATGLAILPAITFALLAKLFFVQASFPHVAAIGSQVLLPLGLLHLPSLALAILAKFPAIAFALFAKLLFLLTRRRQFLAVDALLGRRSSRHQGDD
jgi:hypothetical protein